MKNPDAAIDDLEPPQMLGLRVDVEAIALARRFYIRLNIVS